MAIGPIIQGVIGLAKTAGAAATKVGEEQALKATPEERRAVAIAERRMREGLTPAERRIADQRMIRQRGMAERDLRRMGFGGLSSAISNFYNLDFMRQMAELGERERRRGEQMYTRSATRLGQIEREQQRLENQRIRQEKIAKGKAIASGLQDLSGAAMGLGTAFAGGTDYTPEQLSQIEQMKQNRPMERTPDSTLMGTPPDEVDYQGMFADAPFATDMRTDPTRTSQILPRETAFEFAPDPITADRISIDPESYSVNYLGAGGGSVTGYSQDQVGPEVPADYFFSGSPLSNVGPLSNIYGQSPFVIR